MSDPTYRVANPTKSQPEPTAQAPDKVATTNEVETEPPFTSYEADKGKPYLVDHYELGSLWNEADMYSDGYKGEVETINKYLDQQIGRGEINNTLDSVKTELKRIEKMINVKKDARTAVKVGLVTAHVKFLLETDDIKKTAGKYGMK